MRLPKSIKLGHFTFQIKELDPDIADEDLMILFDHCCNVYPERFFDILNTPPDFDKTRPILKIEKDISGSFFSNSKTFDSHFITT